MTISKIQSAIPTGTTANLVTAECDSTLGLPSLNIIGMANKTIEESRERIRAGIRNSGFRFPNKEKITINLAPAELPKTGTHLDLAIATAILTHSGQFPRQNPSLCLFVGELALDGRIRPVKGILNIIETATKHRFKTIYIPSSNAAQAALFQEKNIQIIPVSSLTELWQIITGTKPPINITTRYVVKNTKTDLKRPILDEIIGLEQAKRALTIAVAGHHNLIISGPPGAGKSLLANTIPNLLPAPSQQEIFELTKLYSLTTNLTGPFILRPFRAPHHSISRTKLIGGADGLPGEISLAHLGVLYLDELPEFRRDCLEALRQPLEDHLITIQYAHQRIRYPANFMLVATMNPCPCGYYGANNTKPCTCTPYDIANYHRKLSGPLLDRIDLTITVQPHDSSVLVKNTTISTQPHTSANSQQLSAEKQIQTALNNQFNRQHKYNSDLSSVETIQYCQLGSDAEQFLAEAAKSYNLSARAYFKTLKVARTIADIEGIPFIQISHLSEALQYRQEV